jgi:hypothetical protein|tara:strand:- start:774 stop:1220 length:447 start_codon:yes stop_codon:yes gene_type:complete
MPDVFSGARARFTINDRPVGYCAGVSGEEAIDYEPVDTLGFLEVREHVPVAYRASLSAAFFRLIGSPLKKYGGKYGKAGNLKIFPILDDILTSGVLSASVEEKLGGKTLATFLGVRAASKTFDVSSRGVVSENCSFVAIRQRDESEDD